MSEIQWLHMPGYKPESLNPITGCTPVSEGCAHCYAARTAAWLERMGNDKYAGVTRDGRWSGRIRLLPEVVEQPRRWTAPRMIFWCSMSDLFHEDVPFEFIDRVMQVVRATPQHLHLWLTKRSARLRRYFRVRGIGWGLSYPHDVPDNLWVGVTAETQARADERLDDLWDIQVGTHFVSMEPMLGPVKLGEYAYFLDWVICGGESGERARPMDPAWACALRDECRRCDIPFFFKQHGGRVKVDGAWGGQELDGQVWHQFPAYDEERVQEV